MEPSIDLTMAQMNGMMIFQIPVQKRPIPSGLPVSAIMRWLGDHTGKLLLKFRSQLPWTSGAFLFVQSTEAMFVHPVDDEINTLAAQMVASAQFKWGRSIHK